MKVKLESISINEKIKKLLIMSPLTATITFMVTLVILIFILFWVLILLNNCKYSLKDKKSEKSNNFENQPGFSRNNETFPTITPQYQTNTINTPMPVPIGYEQKVLSSGSSNMRVIKLNNTPQYQTSNGSNVLFVVKENEGNNFRKYKLDDIENNPEESPVVKKLRLKLRDARKRIREREEERSSKEKENLEKSSSGSRRMKIRRNETPKIEDVLDRLKKLEGNEKPSVQSIREDSNQPTAVIIAKSSVDRSNRQVSVNESNQRTSGVGKVKYVVPSNTLAIIKQ